MLPIKSFYAFSILSVLFINPGACSRACGHEALNAEKAAARETAERAAKEQAAEQAAAREAKKIAAQKAKQQARQDAANGSTGEKESSGFLCNKPAPEGGDQNPGYSNVTEPTEGGYLYRKSKYVHFTDIPFSPGEKVYVNHRLTDDEAQYLMNHDVKFVFNNSTYLDQENQQFVLVFLIPQDIATTQELYGLDKEQAIKLMGICSNLPVDDKIIKVSSYKELLEEQQKTISNNQVPILIFHNDPDKVGSLHFQPETNFLTCNSLTVAPNASLVSTDLLDLTTVIEGVDAAYKKSTLGEFYNAFTEKYYEQINARHGQATLLYIAGGVGLGGVTAYAYYSKKT